MIPTKAGLSLVDREVVTEEPAPAQLEDSPLSFGQGYESITGVTDGLGWRGTELRKPIGQTLVFLNQDVVTGKGFAAHAIEHALKLRAVPSMWPRTEFLRQMRNILTEIVHGALLIGSAALDYDQRQLICAMESSQSGDSYL